MDELLRITRQKGRLTLVVPPGMLDTEPLTLMLDHDGEGVGMVLNRKHVEALHDALGNWLVDTQPDPAIPGRPV